MTRKELITLLNLIETGCKNIALVSNIDNLSVGKLRIEGYKDALRDHNMPLDDTLILRIDEFNDIHTLLKNLLGSQKQLDGLLCLEEDSAVDSLKIVLSQGYKIPEDISIIGFTNGKLPKHVTPAITTVSQHGIYLGETAARILINKLEQGDSEETEYTTKVIKTSIIERETTKKIEY